MRLKVTVSIGCIVELDYAELRYKPRDASFKCFQESAIMQSDALQPGPGGKDDVNAKTGISGRSRH